MKIRWLQLSALVNIPIFQARLLCSLKTIGHLKSGPRKEPLSSKTMLRYRPDTPLVLKGLSLIVRGGDSVGVVGITGSGKSTLLQALFRLIEPAGGRIFIDGLDISTLGLSDLRSKLGIIPQEPSLFQGTVRTNIDPLGIYTDEQVWEGLWKCELADIIQEKLEKLDYEVADDGVNWSVGQKHLFCLGRAILKRSRILFVD